MYKKLLIACLLSLAGMAAANAAAMTYTLDPNHTQVSFCWVHFGFSKPCANFNKVEGTLVFNQSDPVRSSVNVVMSVPSLDTHVAALNKRLKLATFFDAAQFSTVRFHSTRVIPEQHSGHFLIEGELTVRGITHPVTLQAVLNKIGIQPLWKAPAIGFEAHTTLDRKDFGMAAYVPMVSNQLQVRITVEAIDSRAYAKAMAKKEAK